MNTYKVSLCRVENTLYHFQIEADSEDEAEQIAWEMYNEGDTDDGDVVHAEEFCHQIQENLK
jgi:hypothetical protein